MLRKLPALPFRLMAWSRSIWAWWTSSWPRPHRQWAPTRTRGPWTAPLLLHGCEEPFGVLQSGSTGLRTCWGGCRSILRSEEAFIKLQRESTASRMPLDGSRATPRTPGCAVTAVDQVHSCEEALSVLQSVSTASQKLLMYFRVALQAWRRTRLALDRVHRCAEARAVLQSGSPGVKTYWVGFRSSPPLWRSSWCASEWFPVMPSWNQRSWPRLSTVCWTILRLQRLWRGPWQSWNQQICPRPSTSRWRMMRLPRLCGYFWVPEPPRMELRPPLNPQATGLQRWMNMLPMDSSIASNTPRLLEPASRHFNLLQNKCTILLMIKISSLW